MSTQSPSDPAMVEQIARLLNSLEASGRSVLMREDQDLLQSIVDAAAQIFGAAAASIALVDEAQQKLVFKVAYGAGKENVVGLSVDLDHGLAGYVVMTGQPISVRDVKQDARFNKDFAGSTGYVPRSILATPLLVEDQVIGVMEVLDKINATSFGMQDMDLLALFAHQAAIAIHQFQQYERLGAALVSGLRRLVNEKDSPELAQALDSVQRAGQETPPDENLLKIADQLYALSQLGPSERRACYDVLQVFARYARSKTVRY
jgi:GAF domain-containing protein